VRVCNLLALIGLAFALSNQVAKAAVDVGAPGVRTDGIALIRGYEAYVRKPNFRFAVFLGDFEDNVGILPFARVLYEVKVVVRNVPRYFFTGNKLDDSKGTAVNILVMVLEFAEFVGDALDFLRPPSANVMDGGEDFFRALVYGKRSTIVLIHSENTLQYLVDSFMSIDYVLAIYKYNELRNASTDCITHLMKKATFSVCPIVYALDLWGDPWSLVILRDVLIHNKRYYREFLASRERISTNILSARLQSLVESGLLVKIEGESNRAQTQYRPTPKALDLFPAFLPSCTGA